MPIQRSHFVLAGTVVLVGIGPVLAQDATVLVDGNRMAVQTVGVHGLGNDPVVVFEAGAGSGLATWSTVLEEVWQFARSVAYDRSGIGGSEPDGHRPTPQHAAVKLRHLLTEMDVAPPYLLVGHSWGGPLIRMFTALFPADVAGLVYVDPTALRSEQQHLAYLRSSGFTAEGARDHTEGSRKRMAGFVAALAGPRKAEMEVIANHEGSFAAQFRELKPIPMVPVTVLVSGHFEPSVWTGRPCEPKVCHEQGLMHRTSWLTSLAPEDGAEARHGAGRKSTRHSAR